MYELHIMNLFYVLEIPELGVGNKFYCIDTVVQVRT